MKVGAQIGMVKEQVAMEKGVAAGGMLPLAVHQERGLPLDVERMRAEGASERGPHAAVALRLLTAGARQMVGPRSQWPWSPR